VNLQMGNALNKATRSAVTTSSTSSPMWMALDTKGSSPGIVSYPYMIAATTDPENLGVIRILISIFERTGLTSGYAWHSPEVWQSNSGALGGLSVSA